MCTNKVIFHSAIDDAAIGENESQVTALPTEQEVSIQVPDVPSTL